MRCAIVHFYLGLGLRLELVLGLGFGIGLGLGLGTIPNLFPGRGNVKVIEIIATNVVRVRYKEMSKAKTFVERTVMFVLQEYQQEMFLKKQRGLPKSLSILCSCI